MGQAECDCQQKFTAGALPNSAHAHHAAEYLKGHGALQHMIKCWSMLSIVGSNHETTTIMESTCLSACLSRLLMMSHSLRLLL